MDGILAPFEDAWGLRLVMPCAALDWDLVLRSIQLLVEEVRVIRHAVGHAVGLCFQHLAT